MGRDSTAEIAENGRTDGQGRQPVLLVFHGAKSLPPRCSRHPFFPPALAGLLPAWGGRRGTAREVFMEQEKEQKQENPRYTPVTQGTQG